MLFQNRSFQLYMVKDLSVDMKMQFELYRKIQKFSSKTSIRNKINYLAFNA